MKNRSGKYRKKTDLLPILPKNIPEELIAEVVHKIKNGLGGILGFASLLDRDLDPHDSRKRLVQRIQDGVVKLNDFVMDLMMLVRQGEPVFEKVEFNSLIRETWRQYWGDQEKINDITIIHPADHEAKIEFSTDSEMIFQLIHHIIRFVNGIGGKIMLVKIVPKSKDTIVLEFHITGGAFPKDGSTNLNRMMATCEPVEARLSFAILFKLAGVLGGSIALLKQSGNQWELDVQLKKRN
jgi:K+-sensing histidine kinase KdpD